MKEDWNRNELWAGMDEYCSDTSAFRVKPNESTQDSIHSMRIQSICIHSLLRNRSHHWGCEVWLKCRIPPSWVWSRSPNAICGTKAFQRISDKNNPSYPGCSFMALQPCIYIWGALSIFDWSFVFYFSSHNPHCRHSSCSLQDMPSRWDI